MQPVAVGFHDIVAARSLALPIAPGHSTVYTLGAVEFREHLQAIRARAGNRGIARIDCCAAGGSLLLTFDDGAIGSYVYAAPELERLHWPGHFFVTTNWIGRPGFLDRQKIRELHERGHLIGSHSCSHPERISRLDPAGLIDEWARSCGVLGDIIGQRVRVASVPGGFYSRAVAQAAFEAGIEVLFTSEPTTAASFVGGCLVLGRYSIRGDTSTATSGALAAGAEWPWRRQAAAWRFKKAAKQLMGERYFTLRRMLLAWETFHS